MGRDGIGGAGMAGLGGYPNGAPGDRYYVIELPAQAANAPMILALHGGGGNPDQFARNTGVSKPALAQGHAVIYPAGSALGRVGFLTWNGG